MSSHSHILSRWSNNWGCCVSPFPPLHNSFSFVRHIKLSIYFFFFSYIQEPCRCICFLSGMLVVGPRPCCCRHICSWRWCLKAHVTSSWCYTRPKLQLLVRYLGNMGDFRLLKKKNATGMTRMWNSAFTTSVCWPLSRIHRCFSHNSFLLLGFYTFDFYFISTSELHVSMSEAVCFSQSFFYFNSHFSTLNHILYWLCHFPSLQSSISCFHLQACTGWSHDSKTHLLYFLPTSIHPLPIPTSEKSSEVHKGIGVPQYLLRLTAQSRASLNQLANLQRKHTA